MRWTRFLLFLLSILLGVGAGVAYGWVIGRPDYNNLAPDSLSADYKADYVLMVAEIYAQDANLPQALRRLTQLDAQLTPARSVAKALLTARDLEYAPADLELMGALARAVKANEVDGTSLPGDDGRLPRSRRLARPQPPPPVRRSHEFVPLALHRLFAPAKPLVPADRAVDWPGRRVCCIRW